MEKNSKMQVFWSVLVLMLVLDFAVIVVRTDAHDTASLVNCGIMGVLIFVWRKLYKPRDL